MGTVWVAEQTEPVKRKVALKLIKAGMDSKAVLARFEAERQALAMMDHPNIAKVLDGGLTDVGRPYFVMEYVKGVPITEYCDSLKLSVSERLELFVQVCSAIQHAHQKGIIHRDLKPSNILVAPYDDRPIPKVIDFGLAKALHQRLTDRTLHTAHETVIGTPLYMSPEQAQLNNLDVDTRSDVYSLGVLLYELLTGTTPIEKARFREAAWDEVRRIIREEEPPRPSTRISSTAMLPSLAACRQADPSRLTQQVRGELDWIVMKALEKERTRRYETATGLAKDVRRYLTGEAVEACPPTMSYRLQKFLNRHRAAALLSSAFVSLVIFAAILASYLALRADYARENEMEQRQLAEHRLAEANRQRERAEYERERAEREQKRAEVEQQAANAVRQFLQSDLLKQASMMEQANSMPLNGGEFEIKPNPTINELLDRAAVQLAPDRIEAKFPNMPFVQAEVLHAVATAYSGIGKDHETLSLLDRAIPLYLTTCGPQDQRTLAAQSLQAQTHHYQGDYDRAEQIYAAVVAIADETLGQRDRFAFETRVWQARNITVKGSTDAISLLQRLKSLGTEYFGQGDYLTILASGHLAMAYRLKGNVPQAIREMEEVLEIVRSTKVRLDHPMFYVGFGELAEAYKAMNRIDKATEVLQSLIDMWAERGEPLNGRTWNPRHDLAWLIANNGDTSAAAKLFEDNVKAAPVPPAKLMSYSGLHSMELKLGRNDDALVHARLGLDAVLEGHPADYSSWYTGMGRLNVGRLLQRMQDFHAAEPFLADAFRDLLHHDGDRPPWDDRKLLREAHKLLAEHYKASNRHDDAARITNQLSAVLSHPDKAGATWKSKYNAGWPAFQAGEFSTAAALFEASLTLTSTPEEKSRSYHGLFESKRKLGRLDDALRHARDAVDVIVAARGPDHHSYRLGAARSSLGSLLYQLKDFSAAELQLIAGCRDVVDHVDQIPKFDYPHRHVAFDDLIALLNDSGRADEAKKWSAARQELLSKLKDQTLTGDSFTKDTVALVRELVNSYIRDNRHNEALALYREINSKYTAADKSVSDEWLRIASSVMNDCESKLQFDQNKPWAEMRLPVLKRDFDSLRQANPSEIAFLRAANLLAHNYVHAGENAEAVRIVEELFVRQREKGWMTDVDAVNSYGSTTKAIVLAGHPELAVEFSSAVFEQLSKEDAPPEAQALGRFGLGFALFHRGDLARAEEHLREALQLQLKFDAKHWRAAKFKTWLGIALHEQKKFESAEQVLIEAYAECVEKHGNTPVWEKQHSLLAAGRLAILYEAIKQPDKAAKWKKLSTVN